jgi:hypothetical protein
MIELNNLEKTPAKVLCDVLDGELSLLMGGISMKNVQTNIVKGNDRNVYNNNQDSRTYIEESFDSYDVS